jgi:hypothetical protein
MDERKHRRLVARAAAEKLPLTSSCPVCQTHTHDSWSLGLTRSSSPVVGFMRSPGRPRLRPMSLGLADNDADNDTV